MSQRKKTVRKNNGKKFSGENIEDFMPLVFTLAKKYHTFFPHLEMEELIEEGKTGILEASFKYDEDKNAAFSTYAWFWILKKIQDYISKNVNIIEMPQNVRKSFSQIKKVIDNEAKRGKTISISEISKILGLNVSEVSDILALTGNVVNAVSLDKEIESGDQIRSLSESVQDKSQPDIFDSIIQESDNSMLNELLSKLSENEQAVLSFRFSLGGYSDKKVSIKSIAEKLSVSPAKVKDLEQSALTKLKGMIKTINEQE